MPFTRRISLGGQAVTLRPLAGPDEAALGEYFVGLSERTRRVYAPHAFGPLRPRVLGNTGLATTSLAPPPPTTNGGVAGVPVSGLPTIAPVPRPLHML